MRTGMIVIASVVLLATACEKRQRAVLPRRLRPRRAPSATSRCPLPEHADLLAMSEPAPYGAMAGVRLEAVCSAPERWHTLDRGPRARGRTRAALTQGRPLASLRDVRHPGLLNKDRTWCDDVWASFAPGGSHPRKMTTSSAGQFTQYWVTPDLSQFGSRFQTPFIPGPIRASLLRRISWPLWACGPMSDGAMDSRSKQAGNGGG